MVWRNCRSCASRQPADLFFLHVLAVAVFTREIERIARIEHAVDIFITAVQKAGGNLNTDNFIKAMDSMTVPGDMFGSPPMTFSATMRCRLGSQASHTTAMPPRPRTARISYRPILLSAVDMTPGNRARRQAAMASFSFNNC